MQDCRGGADKDIMTYKKVGEVQREGDDGSGTGRDVIIRRRLGEV
jgi:hypothetical protein